MDHLIIQGEDASDWVYIGEGNANLVLSYRGSVPHFIGKVLRVQKARREEPQFEKKKQLLSNDECLLWKDMQELVASVSKEISGRLYVLHVMSPLLGSEHVDAGVHVLVSKEFLESIEKNVSSQRPAWRVDAAMVNTFCDFALLISDHSVFPPGNLKEDFCVSVEIKPKCGFLPSSRFISERNAVKTSVTRFRMHQFLKLHQKEISQVSEYDPLDLFSGSRDRIIRAVKSLISTPQNNFRLFLNSSLVFGALGGGMDDVADSQTCKVSEAFEDVIKDVILADRSHRLECFLELLAEMIIRSGVLGRLLSVQKLDKFDIEGAIHAYYNIISQPCPICKGLGDVKLSHQYSYIHSMSLEESQRIVREYLIAATAKDCSLMISFRPRMDQDLASEYSSISLESTKQDFEYKAYFVDLDMKPLSKMVHSYELDQKIVGYYNQMEMTERATVS